MIEKIHLKFCKIVLNLKTSTPFFVIYGELCRTPLSLNVKMQMMKYWVKLLHGKTYILYKLLCIVRNEGAKFKWITSMHTGYTGYFTELWFEFCLALTECRKY
jgi:hypothetical protein